jgi:hypothetical protein
MRQTRSRPGAQGVAGERVAVGGVVLGCMFGQNDSGGKLEH